MRIQFWGVRGSAPAPHASALRYGGNTPCVEVRAGNQFFIFDAGTGLRDLGRQLAVELGGDPLNAALFLSHYHWDHVQGLPFFEPLYREGGTLRIFGPRLAPGSGTGLAGVLKALFGPPFFPISTDRMQALTPLQELEPGSEFTLGDTRVRTCGLHHPHAVLAYRLEHGGASLVYATDHQPGDAARDAELLDLARRADLLILDAQLRPDEIPAGRNDYGHGTWESAVRLARAAGAKNLFLFHHDPSRADDEVDLILEEARRAFPSTYAAGEGMMVEAEAGHVNVWARHGRSSQRVHLPLEVEVETLGQGGTVRHRAQLENIGIRGAYLRSPQPYEPHQPLYLIVSLPVEDAAAPSEMRLRGTVARVFPHQTNGGWTGVGVSFSEPASLDVLRLPASDDDPNDIN